VSIFSHVTQRGRLKGTGARRSPASCRCEHSSVAVAGGKVASAPRRLAGLIINWRPGLHISTQPVLRCMGTSAEAAPASAV
jgi:hypothetical protein